MANLLLGWPVYSDPSVLFTPTRSGGNFSPLLPLSNLSDTRLSRVARSIDATEASTQWDTDLKTPRLVRAAALPKHTISPAGTVRLRGYTGAGHSSLAYDSGIITPWPAGLTAEDVAGLNVPFVVFPAATFRYGFWEISDTGNPAGYVDIAREILAGGFQPTFNMSYGASLGLETATVAADTEGGSTIYNRKPMRRVLTGVLDLLSESEAFSGWWRMCKQANTSEQFWVSYDPSDVEPQRHNRNFLAVFKQPSALAQPYFARHQGAFVFREEL